MHCLSSRVLVGLHVLVACAFVLLGSALRAQCGASWVPVNGGDPISAPRGIVNATINWDPDGTGPLPTSFTVGGRMAVADTPLCNVAFHDGSRWTALPQISLSEVVLSLQIFNGELVAILRTRVVRWTGSTWVAIGQFGSFAPATTTFKAAAVFQNELYVGGLFSSITLPGQPAVTAPGIARWNGTNWSAVGALNAITPDVRALAVFNGNLVAGGSFSSIGGVSATNLGNWNGTTWSASGNPNASVDSLGVRSSVALTSTLLFVGGRFTSIGGVAAQGVARVAALVGSSWNAMSGLPASSVTDGVTLFVRGVGTSSFECNAGTGSTVHRWNGTAWTQVFEVAPATVSCLTQQGGQLTSGVNALEFNDPSKSSYALRRADGTTLHGQGIGGNVLAVTEFNGQTVIAGDFQQIDGTTVNGVAIGSAGNWQPLGNGVTGGVGKVRAMVVANGSLHVGGDFALATGGVADRLAVWNGTSWGQVGGGGANGPVHALASVQSTIMAGGSFTTMAGVNARGLAVFQSGVWSNAGGGLDGNTGNPVVDHLSNIGGFFCVGGRFVTAGTGNLFVNNLARFTLNGARWDPFLLSGTFFGAPAVGAVGVRRSTSEWLVAVQSNDPAWQVIYSGSNSSGNNGIILTPVERVPGAVLQVNDAQAFQATVDDVWLLYRGQLQEIVGTITTTLTGSLARLGAVGTTNATPPTEDYPIALLGGGRGSLLIRFDGDMVVGGMARAAAETVVRGGVGQLVPNCRATATSFGSGCGSATDPSAPQSLVDNLPWTDEGALLRTNNIRPNSFGVVVLGFQTAATPLSVILPGLGGPCDLLVNPVATLLVTPPSGTSTAIHVIVIPNSPSLNGVQVLDQVLNVRTGPNGIEGLAASQGVALVVGSRP